MKAFQMILALVLALALTGCGTPAAQPAQTPATQVPVATAEPVPAPTPGATQAPAATFAMKDPYAVTFLGEDTAALDDKGGVGSQGAEKAASQLYGEKFGGNLQTYACMGLAEYQGDTYYVVYWSQLVKDEGGGGHKSYMGHLYVSPDGETVLEGDDSTVYQDFSGG